MLSLESDYIEGAHEKILTRLTETNLEPLPGYGADPYTASAKEKIRAACDCPNAGIWLLTGGTQTNALVIDTVLTRYEGVIAADTGHIALHEAGAVEALGHKVLPLPAENGKLAAETLRASLTAFQKDENREHIVPPGMVYLSYPTEYGTLYAKEELAELHRLCREFSLSLYIDGARLGYGLASSACDLTLPELARLCDVFYIGGTKVGALCGEAVVFPNGDAPEHAITQIKRHGALLAKGRLLGIQFDTLFTDGLYEELSRHAIKEADRLRAGLEAYGYEMVFGSPTNQVFVRLSDAEYERLREKVRMSFWEKPDEAHTIVRLATSWATPPETVDGFLALLMHEREDFRPADENSCGMSQ